MFSSFKANGRFINSTLKDKSNQNSDSQTRNKEKTFINSKQDISVVPSMPILAQRSRGYRVGVVMLIVGFILYSVGFSTISWTTSKSKTEGLWQVRHAVDHGIIFYSSNVNAEGKRWYECDQIFSL